MLLLLLTPPFSSSWVLKFHFWCLLEGSFAVGLGFVNPSRDAAQATGNVQACPCLPDTVGIVRASPAPSQHWGWQHGKADGL